MGVLPEGGLDGFAAVSGGGRDDEVLFEGEKGAEGFSDEEFVVGKDDADRCGHCASVESGSQASRCPPSSSVLVKVSRPPAPA